MGIEPPATVRSDGALAWIDAAADVSAHHPATLKPDPAISAQQHEEFFLWDLCGVSQNRPSFSPSFLRHLELT